jgi:hypothetical protein
MKRLTLSAEEVLALRRYLESGGFLLAEACCGRLSFDLAFRDAMHRVFPGQALEPVPPDSILFREPNRIEQLRVTPSLAARHGAPLMRPRLEGIRIGDNFVVVYSPAERLHAAASMARCARKRRQSSRQR